MRNPIIEISAVFVKAFVLFEPTREAVSGQYAGCSPRLQLNKTQRLEDYLSKTENGYKGISISEAVLGRHVNTEIVLNVLLNPRHLHHSSLSQLRPLPPLRHSHPWRAYSMRSASSSRGPSFSTSLPNLATQYGSSTLSSGK